MQVHLYEREFLMHHGDPEWLKGVDHIPRKLHAIMEINKLLAHQPWLVTKDHIEVSIHNNYLQFFDCFIYKSLKIIIINPILIRVYPRKWGWPDLLHSKSNLSNSHSSSCSIQGILLLQANTLALLLHLHLSRLRFLLTFTSNSNAFINQSINRYFRLPLQIHIISCIYVS